MRKVLKWIGIILGGLLVLVVLIAAASYFIAEDRINSTYEITAEEVIIPEQVDMDRDKWPLILIELCEECHGYNLAGQVMDEDPLFGTFVSANLTSGKGGVGSTYEDSDWIRALRHGINQEGRPLIIMPAQSIGKLSNRDLGEVIAYVKSVPPIDHELPDIKVGPLARIILTLGLAPDVLPAEIIDHDEFRSDPVPGESVEYGKYLSFICEVCHFEDLSGGPEAGEGMNLTPGGQLATWTEEDFFETMRTGVAPDGKRLDNNEMPWRTFRKLSDVELKAIWLYLQSIPAVETEYR